MFVRTQEKNCYNHKNGKTTELSLTGIQTLQDLFYRTIYKQIRYMMSEIFLRHTEIFLLLLMNLNVMEPTPIFGNFCVRNKWMVPIPYSNRSETIG